MRDKRGLTFSFLWIMAGSDGLKLKCLDGFFFLQTHSFSFNKMLIDVLQTCGLHVDYYDICISCLDSHSDGTHSQQVM